MKNILVTGGAGFIGSHVARRLLHEGLAVRVLDNLDAFYSERIKRWNLEQIAAGAPRPDRFEFVDGDIRDPAACARAVEGIDAVLHMAALAGVRPSIDDPSRYMDVNVTGTQTLLSALSARPSVPILFASSSSVYGGNDKVPFAESDPVDRPVSPYAASKRAGEAICHAHHRLYGNPITSLRFFTVYGPGQRPEMAIHLFSRLLVDGEPIPMFGDGSTSRDYTYIDDIVEGAIGALHKADGYRVYNLGGSTTTTLRELVGCLEEVFGRKATIDQRAEQPGDVRRTWADTSLAENELGYRARVSLREGLERFAVWFRSARESGVLA